MAKAVAYAVLDTHRQVHEENGNEFKQFFKGDYQKYNNFTELVNERWFSLDDVLNLEVSAYSFVRTSVSPLIVVNENENNYLVQLMPVRYFPKGYFIASFKAINTNSEYVAKVRWHYIMGDYLHNPRDIDLKIPGKLAADMFMQTCDLCKEKKLLAKGDKELYTWGKLEQEIAEINNVLKQK